MVSNIQAYPFVRTLGMDSPEERESKALLKLMEFSEQLLLQPEVSAARSMNE